MSDPVFVVDATGTPLMPMAPAYARRLLQNGKAHIVQHHTLSIIQLTRDIASPTLRPLVLAVAIHLDSAELFLIAAGNQRSFPLAHILIDLRTDLAWRIRRRAGHRRRRHLRSRYHAPRRMGMPYKLHRPSLARSQWGSELRQRHQRTHHRGRQGGSPVMHWRAQAICRVIAVLQGYAPISQVLILTHHGHRLLTPL